MTTMSDVFKNAAAFDQNIRSWDGREVFRRVEFPSWQGARLLRGSCHPAYLLYVSVMGSYMSLWFSKP